MLSLVYDYIDVTQFGNYVFSLLLRCVFKNFSHFSSIDVTLYCKAMAHCVCCVWDSLVWVWGSECAAGGFVLGVCVCRHCVCCVWDSLERVWGSECAAGGFVVGGCVCVSALCVVHVGQFGVGLGE